MDTQRLIDLASAERSSPSVRFRHGRSRRPVAGTSGFVRGGLETRGVRRRIGMLVLVTTIILGASAAMRGMAPLTPEELAEISASYQGLVPVVADPPDAVATADAKDPASSVGALARVFAVHDGLQIGLPSPNVLLIGYHEAANRSALTLEPAGRLLTNENARKVTPPDDVRDGPGYLVLSSRGRRMPGLSAVDLVLRDGEPVMAPISGTVIDVSPYALYGRYPDTLLAIEPDGFPGVKVVLIHIVDVQVTTGQHVVAGQTQLAGGPNRFPFTSHIDRYFPTDRWPHVHLEVHPR